MRSIRRTKCIAVHGVRSTGHPLTRTLHGTALTADWPLIQAAYRFGFAFVPLDCFAGTFTVGVYLAPQFALDVFVAHGLSLSAHTSTQSANAGQSLSFQWKGSADTVAAWKRMVAASPAVLLDLHNYCTPAPARLSTVSLR